jgi:Toprim-like
MDLLAALGHSWASGVEDEIGPVAMGSAGESIPDEAIPYFKEKRVKIFSDNDKAGHEAFQRWAEQLAGVAAKVDGYDFTGLIQTDGNPVKDLNDLLKIDYDCWEQNQNRIESIMDF